LLDEDARVLHVAVEGINSKKLVYEKLYVSRGKEEPEESRDILSYLRQGFSLPLGSLIS
jgi:hypothetical protein